MNIKKIDGTKRVYIMKNGDVVPFTELQLYKTGQTASSPKPKKKRKRKKKPQE